MKLHHTPNEFVEAVKFTADKMGINAIYVEKDYWVTYALHTIFNHDIGKKTVFKGGTALSKCYNIIERFSEDIDLVVLRNGDESNNNLTTKIKKISAVVSAALPEVHVEGLTQKMGMNRKTAHNYNKEFTGSYGQVRDVIIVEATWLGYYEPYTVKPIISFVGQMMLDSKQTELAKEYGLLAFEVLVLEPTRTICEKIMSLVRFSYSESPIEDLKKKIRHTYDLHQLLQQTEFFDYFQSAAFEEMLVKVANDDVASYKNNNKWLEHHPKEALVFKDLDNVWRELKTTYAGDFKNLVYGKFPEEKDVFASLAMIKKRLETIDWQVKVEG